MPEIRMGFSCFCSTKTCNDRVEVFLLLFVGQGRNGNSIFRQQKSGVVRPRFFRAPAQAGTNLKYYTSAMTSTSQSTCLGRVLTATQERAGRLAICSL